MNQFLEYLEGTFANKLQAQSHPTRYAHIVVKHIRIGDTRFYGQQAYNYLPENPYRQFVIDVEVEKGQFRLKNYEIEDAKRFVDGQNLELLTDEVLTYREGCDIIISQTGPEMFQGGTSTCECWVNWQGIKTYVQNEITLTKTEYHVVDRGLHAETHDKIWGSDWGAFKFTKVPE